MAEQITDHNPQELPSVQKIVLGVKQIFRKHLIPAEFCSHSKHGRPIT